MIRKLYLISQRSYECWDYSFRSNNGDNYIYIEIIIYVSKSEDVLHFFDSNIVLTYISIQLTAW